MEPSEYAGQQVIRPRFRGGSQPLNEDESYEDGCEEQADDAAVLAGAEGAGVGVRVCGLRHRRLQPPHRGLAGLGGRCEATSRCTPSNRPSGNATAAVNILSIRYTERLAANAAVSSVGSRGDSYDNALAETIIGLYKSELVRHRGPWRGLEDLELATLEWVDWFNRRRLHHHNAGRVPPAEAEDLHYQQQHLGHQAETQTKQPA